MIEKCNHKERQGSDKRDFDKEFEEYIRAYSDLDYIYDLGFSDNCGVSNTYCKNDIENDLSGIGGDLSKWNISGMDMSRLRRYWREM